MLKDCSISAIMALFDLDQLCILEQWLVLLGANNSNKMQRGSYALGRD
jgi:hypothetical protein